MKLVKFAAAFALGTAIATSANAGMMHFGFNKGIFGNNSPFDSYQDFFKPGKGRDIFDQHKGKGKGKDKTKGPKKDEAPSPVPLPASALLLLGGLGALGATTRRRRKSA